ncbi:MAG: hypothetical protein RIB98_16605 [Acidimicrobiales bacterium]
MVSEPTTEEVPADIEHPLWRNVAGVAGLLVALTVALVVLTALLGWLLMESRSWNERNDPVDVGQERGSVDPALVSGNG